MGVPYITPAVCIVLLLKQGKITLQDALEKLEQKDQAFIAAFVVGQTSTQRTYAVKTSTRFPAGERVSLPPQNANLQDLTPILEKDKRVKFAYLFGSRARGQAGPLSDTDVAVYLDRRIKHGDYRLKLMEKLAKILKSDQLDLVVLNQAPPLLRHEIIKYGRILKDGDSRRIPFEAEVIRECLDTAYLRQVQRTVLVENIREGTAYGPQRPRRRPARKTS